MCAGLVNQACTTGGISKDFADRLIGENLGRRVRVSQMVQDIGFCLGFVQVGVVAFEIHALLNGKIRLTPELVD